MLEWYWNMKTANVFQTTLEARRRRKL